MTEKALMPKPLYIFLHIHKCAGTFLVRMLERNFPKNSMLSIYYYLKELGLKDEYHIHAEEWVKNLPERQREQVRVIIGHGAYYGIHKYFPGEPRYILLLRPPLSRTISQYRFNLKSAKEYGHEFAGGSLRNDRVTPFLEWMESETRMRNYQTWYLHNWLCRHDHYHHRVTAADLEEVKKKMEDLFFVGTVSNNSLDIPYLLGLLGCWRFVPPANVSRGPMPDISDAEKAAASKEYLALDNNLLDHAAALNRKFIDTHLDYYPRVYKSRILERCWSMLRSARQASHGITRSG